MNNKRTRQNYYNDLIDGGLHDNLDILICYLLDLSEMDNKTVSVDREIKNRVDSSSIFIYNSFSEEHIFLYYNLSSKPINII